MEAVEKTETAVEVMGDFGKIETFTRDDFLKSTVPYDFVYLFIKDGLKYAQARELVELRAKAVGVKGFNSKYKSYMAQYHPENKKVFVNFTEFDGQPMELSCGKYVCRDDVFYTDRFDNEIEVCNHPIMPVERIVNIDDNTEKLRLKYRKGYVWREVIADKETLASASKIVQLASAGIAVNSENAKQLVKFLTDMEALNYDLIPEKKSVGRLGWIKGHGFSPYVEDLIFDGEESFRHLFRSVRPEGDFFAWKAYVNQIRAENNVCARIMLAASFASALVEPCDCLPFFVHLWGGTESGKTVALMLAASVWASPAMGDYIRTFNSTAVAQEMTAGFVNSMPLMYDELQIIKGKNGFDDVVYKLCEGVGRDRGKKTGGVQKLLTWRNAILTTGEFPISESTSGGGAVNRVVEIDCKDMKIFNDPVDVVATLKNLYGLGGSLFVHWLNRAPGNLQRAIDTRLRYMQQFRQFSDVTDKQAMAASLILTADELTEEVIFQDGKRLTVSDIKPFLVTKADIDLNRRCYDFLNDFVVANYAKFNAQNNDNYTGEIYGDARSDYVYIIKSKFDQILTDNGYNARAFLSWAAKNELIKRDGRHSTVKHMIASFGAPRCVALKRQDDSDGFIEVDNDLPF